MNGLSVASEGPDFEPVCTIRLCTRITQKLNRKDLASQVNIMWFHVRRILGRIMDGVALDTEEVVMVTSVKSEVAPALSGQKRPSRVSRGGLGPTLPSIPETQPLTTTGSPSGSRILIRKRSNLASVEEKGRGTDAGPQSESNIFVRGETRGSEGEDESDAVPTGASDQPVEGAPHSELEGQGLGSVDPDPQSGGSTSSLEDFGKTGKGHVSLPMGPPGYNPLYYSSIKEKPTGVKGIGGYFNLTVNNMRVK